MKHQRLFEVIYENIDPWMMQTPDQSKDQIYSGILLDIKRKISFPLEYDGMVFYLIPETKWLARLHLFSSVKNPIKALNAARHLTRKTFMMIPSLKKIYGITPHMKLKKVCEKVNWKLEGTLTSSFMSSAGKLKDQYIIGIERNALDYNDIR
jgi:hypothetical protein